MSLIPTANAGAPVGDFYYVENIGGPGDTAADAPCIKGTTLGAIRIGNPAAGVVIRGDTLSSTIPANRIGGGQVAGGSLTIGNSTTSFQNVVMTDGETAVNGILSVQNSMIAKSTGATPATLDTFVNRDIHGFSDTGYAVFTQAVAGGGAVPNPVALAAGLWSVIVVPNGAGNENAQASMVGYWDGAVWTGNGVSFNFTGGAPNVAIGPVAGGATLNIGGAGIPGAGLNVVFRQLLAASGL